MVRGFEPKDAAMNRNQLFGALFAVVLPLSAFAQAPSTMGGTEKATPSASSASATPTAKPTKTVKSTPVKHQHEKAAQPRNAKAVQKSSGSKSPTPRASVGNGQSAAK
jgi:hypothetical protein